MMAEAIDRETQESLLALLAWWRSAGVDCTFSEVPIDWTARPEAAPGADFDWPAAVPDAVTADVAATAPPALPVSVAPAPASKQMPGQRSASGAPSPETRRPEVRRTSTTSPVALPPGDAAPVPRPVATQADPARQSPSPARAFAPTPPDAAAMAAREAARQAATLEALGATLAGFEGCGLRATAKNLCFYRGSARARLMLIGEAPGREEDLEGKPFVGPSGVLLDKMLAAIGLTEADVHVTNTVYWRPPGNRTPTPQEILVCRPFLDRQIELVGPVVIVTLGGPATKAVLDVTDGILKVRGKWRELDVGSGATIAKIRVMPTLHPAYLLRTPAAKRQAWRDLLAIKAALAMSPS